MINTLKKYIDINNQSILFKLNDDNINHNVFFSNFLLTQIDFVDVVELFLSLANFEDFILII